MPVLGNGIAIGIEDRYLTRPPRDMLTQYDDARRSLSRCRKYLQGMSAVCGGTSVEFRQVSSWSPTPFFLASIGVADQGGGMRRLRATGGEVGEKNAGLAIALEVPEPSPYPNAVRVGVIPIG